MRFDPDAQSDRLLPIPPGPVPAPLLRATFVTAHPDHHEAPTQIEFIVCGPVGDTEHYSFYQRPEAREVGWTVVTHGELMVAFRTIS